MPKSDLRIDSGEYAPVAERITLFYAAHPAGRIVTRLVERDSQVIVFRAAVYRSPDEARPAATGWASERIGDGDVNAVACLENTETSAIGRALANLGFTASTKRPSAEEMAKAARERARLGITSRGGRSDRSPAVTRPLTSRPLRVAETAPAETGDIRSALLDDVQDLLAEAERAGFGQERAVRLRARLASGRTTPVGLERVERGLRSWLAGRASMAPDSPPRVPDIRVP